MKMVPIADLKRRLSELVDEAAAGERIVVTRHNQPVAALVRVEQRPVHTGARFGKARLKPLKVRAKRSIADALDDDRSDRR